MRARYAKRSARRCSRPRSRNHLSTTAWCARAASNSSVDTNQFIGAALSGLAFASSSSPRSRSSRRGLDPTSASAQKRPKSDEICPGRPSSLKSCSAGSTSSSARFGSSGTRYEKRLALTSRCRLRSSPAAASDSSKCSSTLSTAPACQSTKQRRSNARTRSARVGGVGDGSLRDLASAREIADLDYCGRPADGALHQLLYVIRRRQLAGGLEQLGGRVVRASQGRSVRRLFELGRRPLVGLGDAGGEVAGSLLGIGNDLCDASVQPTAL